MNDFHLSITKWYRQNARSLPWRESNDPYIIWLSEIILQQTRVEQGKSYFDKFVKNYPTVKDLANATEQQILNDWQGLGYYSRARNLHFSAKDICNNLNGDFPSSFDEIIKLKGVGEYTAAAISSFAFNEEKAVVDGNVYRLLSRVFNIETPIDSSKGKKEFQELATELIKNNTEGADTHNQAIMEVGALICSPKKPNCLECPLSEKCLAKSKKTIELRPVKTKKIKIRKRYFHFLVHVFEGEIIIEKRKGNDIWTNLFQFPLIETDETPSEEEKVNWESQKMESIEFKHILSHQKIKAVFHIFDEKPLDTNENWSIIPMENIQNYPIPRLIDKFLEEYSSTLRHEV